MPKSSITYEIHPSRQATIRARRNPFVPKVHKRALGDTRDKLTKEELKERVNAVRHVMSQGVSKTKSCTLCGFNLQQYQRYCELLKVSHRTTTKVR